MFTVKVDGVQVGGLQTVNASHNERQVQEFSFTGHFNSAAPRITVEFVNDAYAGTPATDRNLYVEQIFLNGRLVPDSVRTLYDARPAEFYLPAQGDSSSRVPLAPFAPIGSGVRHPETYSAYAPPNALLQVGRGDGHFSRSATDGGVTFTFTDGSGTSRQAELGTAPRVDFADGWVEFAGAGEGATVARLYRGILGRDPDAAGLAFQVHAAERYGATAVAAGMLASPEGQVHTTSSIPDYVAQLYRQQLGREAEAGAAAFWESQLASGVSRATMAAAIATSAEANQDRLGLTANGLAVSRLEALEVGEAYIGVLGRRAEAAGLAHWVARREEGATKSEIAHALANSAEFRDHFGGMADEDFIRTLYRNALGREAEPGSPEAYARMLHEGLTRADLAASFQESPEAAEATLRLAHTGLDLL